MAKPRILISTDIGGSDADDIQSLVHALLYSNEYQLEGLVSTPTNFDGRAADINKVIDAYAKDYAKLKTWDSSYPTPEYLKSIVSQGRIDPQPQKGWSSPSAGSEAIVKAAHESSPSDPLWVLCWGAMTDVAQALHDDPSIKDRIKVFADNHWNGTQDPYAREYIWNSHQNLWWVESKGTHGGIWVDENGTPGKNSWKMQDAIGHGALGQMFYDAIPYVAKMGDTPSLLFVLKNGGNPTAGGWGGSYVKGGHGANYWTDNPDPKLKLGTYPGAGTMQKYQDAIFKDLALHFDHAKAAKSAAPTLPSADDPVLASNDSASTSVDKTVKISVLSNDKAADGGLNIADTDASTAHGGKIVVNSDGTLSYTPLKGYTGTDTFSYTAKDGDGDTAKALVTVKVSPGVTPPPNSNHSVTASDDSYKIDSGKTLAFNPADLLKNDKGFDGGLKVASIDKLGDAGGQLHWNGSGLATYTAKAGFTGTDSLDYVVKDKDGSSDTGTIKITVSRPGSPSPTPAPGAKDLASDNVRDADPGAKNYFNARYLTWERNGPSNDLKVVEIGKISGQGQKVRWEKDGTVIYEAKKGWEGVDRIAFSVADKQGNKDTATIYLEVGKADARAELKAAFAAEVQKWPSESLTAHSAVHPTDPLDTVHPVSLLH